MKKYRSILLLLLAAFVLIGMTGCISVNPNETSPADDMAVHFSTTSLDGTPVTQDFFKDHKVNFVHYWGTWCGYCLLEMPELPKLYEEYKDRVGFIAIVDDATDQATIDVAKQILADSGVTFTNVKPFDQVDDIFGNITGVPCTMLVDERGEPIGKQIIGAVGLDEYKRQLDAALAGAATSPVFNTTSLEGNPISEKVFTAYKVNFVHCWATTCGPCVDEMPVIAQLYEKYKDRVGFIGIVQDANDQATIDTAKKILSGSGVTFVNVPPFDQMTDIFGEINGIPTTVLVDETGKPLTGQIVGAVGIEKYSAIIDGALAAAD